MAKLLKLKLGVSDDPTALQPTLNDCMEAILKQSDLLVTDMVNGLVAATAPNSTRRIAGFQQPGIKMAVLALSGSARTYMYIGPWLALAPGLCITLVVYSVNVLGDALRDLLDPRMRGMR